MSGVGPTRTRGPLPGGSAYEVDLPCRRSEWARLILTQSRRPAICYSITSSACASSVSRSRDKRGSEVNRSPDGHRFRSEPENAQHGGLALVLELRRVDELGLGRSARA